MHLIKYLLFIVLSVSAFSQCTLSINPKTKRLECSGGASVSGGAVGGASNLTTVGAVPYVASAGVLTQAPTGLFYDSANGRLGVGTGSPVAGYKMTLVQPDNAAGTGLIIQANNLSQSISIGWAAITSSSALDVVAGASYLGFTNNGTERMRLSATSGNLLLGGTTDGNYRLDIQKSGSSGTLRVFDQTGGSGTTLMVVQAGVAQSGSVLSIRTSAGVESTALSESFGLAVGTTTNPRSIIVSSTTGQFFYADAGANAIKSNSTGILSWSNSSNATGTIDLGLARNAAGVLEVDSGTAGQYRDLILRRSQHSGVAVSALPAAAAGNAGSIQYVTDANATTISSVVAGGGSNKVLVWSDGTNWKIMAN